MSLLVAAVVTASVTIGPSVVAASIAASTLPEHPASDTATTADASARNERDAPLARECPFTPGSYYEVCGR